MIEARKSGFVGRITLNNPAKHNALDAEMMAQIIKVLDRWTQSDIRVVIIAAKGKSFCAGVSFANGESLDWASSLLQNLCDTVENFTAPVICALQGSVYGGGVELALACDFRIGVMDMKISVPPAKLGVHYEASGIERVMHRLGPQMARRLFLLAEPFSGPVLLSAGFLDFQVDKVELDAKVKAIAATITKLAPMAVQGMKRTIVEIGAARLDADICKTRVAACFASNDHIEGLAAMAEKRAPVFKGD